MLLFNLRWSKRSAFAGARANCVASTTLNGNHKTAFSSAFMVFKTFGDSTVSGSLGTDCVLESISSSFIFDKTSSLLSLSVLPLVIFMNWSFSVTFVSWLTDLMKTLCSHADFFANLKHRKINVENRLCFSVSSEIIVH